MARIAGVDLPRQKRVEIALTYTYGIGVSRSNKNLDKAGIERSVRVKDLSEEETSRIAKIIDMEGGVEGDFLAEIALHAALHVDDLGDAAGLLLGEVLHPDAPLDPGLVQDLVAARHPDPVDVGERDLHPLLPGKVDARDTCHVLSLPLLVLLVGADDAHHTLPAHHLALDADL